MTLTIEIACQSGNAKAEQRDAHVETTATGVRWVLTGKLAQALALRDGWRSIDEQPPLDRPFLGCRVGMERDGKPFMDMTFHIRGLHMDYAGGPRNWTWNEAGGGYGIRLTHWRELPARPEGAEADHDPR